MDNFRSNTIKALTVIIFFFTYALKAQDFDKQKERLIMLDLYDRDISEKTRVLSTGNTNPRNLELVNFYVEEMGPEYERLSVIRLKSNVLRLLLDRALYNSEYEQAKWNDELNALSAEYFAIVNSKDWKAKIAKANELSMNLRGPLVDMLRLVYEHEIKFSLDESYTDLLAELSKIQSDVSDIANNSSYSENSNVQSQVSHKNMTLFLSGEIDFQTASEIHKAASYKAQMQYGNDVAVRAGPLMNRQAIIHSEMAKAKGYSTWAKFIVAQSASSFSPIFQTVEGQIEYLENILKNTEKEFARLIKLRKIQLGLDIESPVPLYARPFLELPFDPAIDTYFLKENFIPTWHTTMSLAGFSQEALSAINIDSKPRPGKYTSAYLFTALNRTPTETMINADDLSFHFSVNPATIIPPQIFWLQNDVVDGLKEFETTLHEGGHALDFFHRQPIIISYETSSYNETHSTFMESFLSDRDFLLKMGKNKDGESPLPDLIDSYLNVRAINKLIRLRYDIGNAIFDLKLWNHDYSESSVNFVDHARQLYAEISNRANLTQGVDVDGIPWQDRLFSTSHFYDGSVRYLGYINAAIAANVITENLNDYFESTTGCRSIFNQPNLADILINGMYAEGYGKPFPESIESFTAYPLSPENFAISANASIRNHIEIEKLNSCTAFLLL